MSCENQIITNKLERAWGARFDRRAPKYSMVKLCALKYLNFALGLIFFVNMSLFLVI